MSSLSGCRLGYISGKYTTHGCRQVYLASVIYYYILHSLCCLHFILILRRCTYLSGAQVKWLLPGCTPPKSKLKRTHLVDTILYVLRDLPLSRNQPLKPANGQYIGIVKNKILGTCSYIFLVLTFPVTKLWTCNY